jgi:hypothetical protein
MGRSPKQEEREQSEHQFEFQISHLMIPLHEMPGAMDYRLPDPIDGGIGPRQ